VSLARYYRWLSWFQQATSWVGVGGGYRSFTVHRLLVAHDPSIADADVVHERMLTAVGRPTSPLVVDAGCGLGGTIFYFQPRLGGEYHGLTLSPAQQARASREASRRGIAGVCHFHVRSYDDDLGDLVGAGADLMVAVESLAHSPAPADSIANLARYLRADGRLLVVDDMPGDALPRSDPDFTAFRDGWHCQHIAPRAAVRSAFDRAGLAIEADDDLTPLVRRRDPAAIESLVRSNRRWRALTGWTGAAQLIDSLYGGLMLERLYARGVMQYRLVVGRRTAASA
jgi:SAM-dependent methyltransferase